MPRVPVEELEPPDAGQRLARPLRGGVHRAERVLRRVARAHAASQARLVGRREARPVEGRPALHLVPDVDHRVQLRVGRLDDEAREVRVPVLAQRAERRVGGGGVAVRGGHPPSLGRVGRDPEHEDDPPLLARRELELVAERADAVPARRLASRRLAPLDDERRREVAAAADECLAVGVEADGRRTRREERRVRAEDGPGQDRRRPRSGCARCAAPSRGSAGRRRRPDSRARRS